MLDGSTLGAELQLAEGKDLDVHLGLPMLNQKVMSLECQLCAMDYVELERLRLVATKHLSWQRTACWFSIGRGALTS